MTARAPLLVGLVLVAAAVTLVYFVIRTNEGGFGAEQTQVYYADFRDASGLRAETSISISGVDVGEVVKIEHVRNERGVIIARVTMRIMDRYTLYQDASLRKEAVSLLGDYRLSLNPGTPERASLPPGGVIKTVQSATDMEEIQSQLRRVASNVNQVTESFARVLAGPKGEGSIQEILSAVEHSMQAIERTSRVLSDIVIRNDENINRVIGHLSEVSQSIADATGPEGDLEKILNNLAETTRSLRPAVEEVSRVVSGQDGKTDSLRTAVYNLNKTASRLDQIARKINQGEGTVGRLINEPDIADQVEETVGAANEFVGGLARLRAQVQLRSEYNVPFNPDNAQLDPAIKNTLALRLWPKPDKFYLLEVVSDPRGNQTREIVTRTEDGVTQRREEVVTSFDDLKFSAQFAKRYYFLTLRFGIIENTGGLGANMHFFNDDLQLRFDMFDFDRRDPEEGSTINPRLRGRAMFEFANHLWLQAGIDDPLNEDLRTWFVGGMLQFTDEDLKSLLPVLPSP